MAVNVEDTPLNIAEIFAALWRGKWVVLGVTLIAAMISLTVALILPNIYKAEALLVPQQTAEGASQGGLPAQYQGLASLAGIQLGNAGNSDVTLAIAVLQSRHFLTDFVAQHDILVPLMAATGWDQKSDKLRIDSSIYNETTNKWVRDVDPPLLPKPSLLEAYKRFLKILSVTRDEDTGYVTVSVEFYSPVVARQWVEWLVTDVNNAIRNRDVGDAKQSLNYLNGLLKDTSLKDVQQVIYGLIEQQIKTIMFANIHSEYVLETVDPAVAPELKAKPQRALICVAGTLIGAILAALGILARLYLRDPR